MTFCDALISAYRENPCRVLPNALWKTLTQVDKFETLFEVENDIVTHVEMWDQEGLHVYWHKHRHPPRIPQERLDCMRFAILHEDYLSAIPAEGFAVQKAFFRLIHKNQPRPTVELPSGFFIANVEADTESEEVAEFIGKCYDGLHPSTQCVQDWTRHPVFDRNSWIWVIDEEKDIPAGLGIAEVDLAVREASLEYIQVLPEYRKKGLGKCIVLELLVRLDGRVEFTTVSGEVVNRMNAESLYRRCGFSGNDAWWLLRR